MSRLFCTSGIADEYDERSSSISPTFGNVDSIESLSRKISCLNSDLRELCPDTGLVVDGYPGLMSREKTMDDDDDEFGFGKLKIDYKLPQKTAKRDSLSTREKEKKDLNRFAGIYAMRAVMSKNQDPLNIKKAQGNMTNIEQKGNSWAKKTANQSSTVSKKPMLVELHSFPGYKSDNLTPLPASLSMKYILNVVIRAQKDLKRKPGFKKEFKKIFLSHPSQAVIQDIFWWFFLDKYQPCKGVQQQLFSRVACNYVKLVFTSYDQNYKETFFKRFPSLVAQTIYAIFCHAFPTSYRQFDAQLKQSLADVTHLWIVGTKPTRRCWEKWPLTFLEPEGMNKEDEIQKHVSKDFDVTLLASRSMDQLADNSGTATAKFDKNPESKASLPMILENGSRLINDSSTQYHPIHPLHTTSNCMASNRSKQGRRKSFAKLDSVNEKYLPSSNHTLDITKSLQSTQTSSSISMNKTRNLKTRESCHAGKGPQFQKVAFDLHGQSPLVKHFLENKKLAKESGTSILVQRTEIERLPPINAPTYQDIIKETLRWSHDLEKQIQNLIEQSSNERTVFARKQKKQREEFRKKEAEVLSHQKEVKKISDLIVLQLAQDQNTDSETLPVSTSSIFDSYFNEKYLK